MIIEPFKSAKMKNRQRFPPIEQDHLVLLCCFSVKRMFPPLFSSLDFLSSLFSLLRPHSPLHLTQTIRLSGAS